MKIDYSATYLYKLHKLTNSLDKLFDRQLRTHATITLSQFSLLLSVDQHKNADQRVIASFLDISPAAVSRQVEIAVGNDWIAVSGARNDRRRQILSITAKGQVAIAQGLQALENHVFQIFDWSDANTHLMQHIDMLLGNIKEAGDYYGPLKGKAMKPLLKAEDLFKKNGGDINKAVIDVQKTAGHPIDQNWWQKNVGQANNDIETARRFDKAYSVYVTNK